MNHIRESDYAVFMGEKMFLKNYWHYVYSMTIIKGTFQELNGNYIVGGLT